VLRRLDSHPSNLFRFPGGCFDAVALRQVAAARVQIVEYDVAGGDAFSTSPSSIVRTTLRGARPGAIIVLHVNGGDTAPATALALPGIISGLRRAGYRLETVSDLLRAGGPQGGLVGLSMNGSRRR
jgi:peptidoglycan/xylan/chitin deacetylase (PgdA/CDA1 family)